MEQANEWRGHLGWLRFTLCEHVHGNLGVWEHGPQENFLNIRSSEITF